MTSPDEAVRAASDAIEAWCAANRARWPDLPEGAWPPEFPGVPRFTAPTEPVKITYTTAPRLGGEPLSTQDAREIMAKLLAKFEAEADHTDAEKRAYAVALRVILGLPEGQSMCEECESAPANAHTVDGWVCNGCAAELNPPGDS